MALFIGMYVGPVYETSHSLVVEPVSEIFCKLVMENRILYMVRTHKLLGSPLLKVPGSQKSFCNIFSCSQLT
jgi:hypothetical protein